MAMDAAPAREENSFTQQALLSEPLLPDDLIVEILSWVPVKALMQFRCVSKTLNSLTFDPIFVKLHLQRSTRNSHVLLEFRECIFPTTDYIHSTYLASPCSIPRLLENPSSAIHDCSHRFKRDQSVSGSCNGLVCMSDYTYYDIERDFMEYWVEVWNPATNIMLDDDLPRLPLYSSNYTIKPFPEVACGFGFDDSCDTYKVVVILLDVKCQEMEVKVYCLGDTCWRKILTFPAVHIQNAPWSGKFTSGTLNWLTHPIGDNPESFSNDKIVIFSYDLKNESYKHLLMPDGFSEVSSVPFLGVLKGCLCLSYDHRYTHLVVWLMREFGNEKSWTELLNVNYDHLIPSWDNQPTYCRIVLPLCMSENEDVMFLANYEGTEFVAYNLIDNNRTNGNHGFKKHAFLRSCEYVQSLVSPF